MGIRKSLGVVVSVVALGLATFGTDVRGSGPPLRTDVVSAHAVTSGELDPNGTLRIGFTVAGGQLDPHRERPIERPHIYLVYDRLFEIDADLDVQPMLATSYEFSDDGLTLTIELRDDVMFHDGTPLGAEAVKISLERAQSLEGSTVANQLESVDSIEVVDPSTVRLLLNKPNASLPAQLAMPVGSIINPVVLEEADRDLGLDSTNAGSGPYVVTEFIPGETAMFERAPNAHWNPEAGRLATIEITGIPESAARLNAFQSGQIDAMTVKQDQITQARQLGETDEVDLYSYPALLHYALLLRSERSELDSVAVRQAISYAIDRDAISTQLLGGDCVATSQPWPVGYWAHNDDLDDAYPFDPARAEELLAEAGLTDGFSFETVVNSGLSPQNEIATVVQAQLAEVGITMNITPLASIEATTEFRSGNRDAYVHVVNGEPDPALLMNNNLLGTYALAADNEELIALADEGGAGTGPDDRAGTYQAVAELMSQEMWYVPICFQPTLYLFPSDVIGDDPLAYAWSGVFDARYLARTSS